MPHTNNPNAKKRKANRADAPAFLQKKKKTEDKKEANKETRAKHVELIQKYHTLEKELAATTDKGRKKEILEEQNKMGGLPKYQEASLHGGDKIRGGETGKWCIAKLKELKVGLEGGQGPIKSPSQKKLRILDVGAISGTSFANVKWIEPTCIDLNPQGENVQKYDFFEFPEPAAGELFDVVALSLVINFIGDLAKRGQALRHAHKYLKPNGLLYLVLPLPCISNSRYCSHERLTSILETTGWEVVLKNDTTKLSSWLLMRNGDGSGNDKTWKKEEINKGVDRNNFCIIVK